MTYQSRLTSAGLALNVFMLTVLRKSPYPLGKSRILPKRRLPRKPLSAAILILALSPTSYWGFLFHSPNGLMEIGQNENCCLIRPRSNSKFKTL